jgi:hypothetical protein
MTTAVVVKTPATKTWVDVTAMTAVETPPAVEVVVVPVTFTVFPSALPRLLPVTSYLTLVVESVR